MAKKTIRIGSALLLLTWTVAVVALLDRGLSQIDASGSGVARELAVMLTFGAAVMWSVVAVLLLSAWLAGRTNARRFAPPHPISLPRDEKRR